MEISQTDPKAEANPLSKKINKILDSQLEHDKETLEALKGLSCLVTENSLNVRRNLRSKIEKQSLAINEQFLGLFMGVKHSIDSLYDNVQSMNGICHAMINKIELTRNRTSHLLSQTNQLRVESKRIGAKQLLAEGFIDSFQLKPEEIMILRGSGSSNVSDDIDDRFFTILLRVKKIHEDSKILLMSNQQTTGIEVMDTMALHQEAAYERLYRWTLSILRSISSETVEVHPQLFQAMSSLQEREMLFKYSIDEFITVRRASVVRNFIDSLTRGGPSGTPVPIERHSSDPLRYIGDMLASLHQSIASEKEILETLLKYCDRKEIVRNKLIENSLSSITEGLSRPLKVRVEQTLISEQVGSTRKITPAVHYRIKNLIKFYHHTMNQTLPSEAPLLYTVNELYTLSHRMFFNSLNYHCVNKIGKGDGNDVEPPPVDLSPTLSLNHIVIILQEVLSSQDTCSVSTDDRKQDVPHILSTVVDPLLKSCIISASKLNAIEMAVFLSNCLNAIHSVIANHDFTDKYKEMIKAQMDAHLDTLISEQASHIIAFLGMSSLYNAVTQKDQLKLPLSTLSGCDPLALQTSMKNLDSFMASPNSLILTQMNAIKNTETVKIFWQRSIELVCSVYKQIYDAVHDPSNGYEDPSSLLYVTPENLKMLL